MHFPEVWNHPSPDPSVTRRRLWPFNHGVGRGWDRVLADGACMKFRVFVDYFLRI